MRVDIPDAYGFGHESLFTEIGRDLRGGIGDLVSPEDGLETIRLLHALYRSSETGTWVCLDDEVDSSRLGRVDETISQLYRRPGYEG